MARLFELNQRYLIKHKSEALLNMRIPHQVGHPFRSNSATQYD